MKKGKVFNDVAVLSVSGFLAKEYAVKTRTELLFFRSQLATASITGPVNSRSSEKGAI